MADNIAIINKTTGKVVATHRTEQNITLEEHYPTDQYGDCEIVVLPRGIRVNYETMDDPRTKLDAKQAESCAVLTKARELEVAAKTDYVALAKTEIIAAK